MQKNNYFIGWYFKCCTENEAISFIPAFHKSHNKENASLQIITENYTTNINFEHLEYQNNPLVIKIGNCLFSKNGIKLNIKTDNLDIYGILNFKKLHKIKYDIMGPFKYVPFLQCRHSVYSMKHTIDGKIKINNKNYIFKNNDGYIEGDCGSSFPKQYIWTQCIFQNGSLMLSIADIPMYGFSFTGIICVILINGKEYRIASYLGAKIISITEDSVTIIQGDYCLTAKLIQKNPHSLFAPENGNMCRTIKESVSCKAYYNFSCKGKILLNLFSDKASFEFEY